MIEIILGAIVVSISFAAGAWFKATIYNNQRWQIYRYDPSVMGYRLLTFGDSVYRGDMIIMALQINTLDLPIEGIPMHDIQENDNGRMK